MKVKSILLLVGLLIFLIGCMSPQQLELREIIFANPNCSPRIKQLIREEGIIVGMTKEQVIASWGEHCWWCYGTTKSSWGDTWQYGYQILFFNSQGILTGWTRTSY